MANFLDEVRSIVYALKGYGGHDLGEFMRDLNYFRAISLDEDGGAEAITAPYEVLKQVFANPNIDKAVTDFNNDWYAVYGEGKGICDL